MKGEKMNNQQIDNTSYYKLPCGKYLEDFIARKCMSFALGSAVKYAWRAGKKDGESQSKDLAKSVHYINFLERHCIYNKIGWEEAVTRLVREAVEWDGK